MRSSWRPHRQGLGLLSAHGFTFLEVLVAMAITVVVLASVFGLLAKALRTPNAQIERADIQAQARHALEQISRDIVLAGTGLPLEFPAFTPLQVNPDLDEQGLGPDAIEMVGNFAGDPAATGVVPLVSFDGHVARLGIEITHIKQGDLVLLYDDESTDGNWTFGLVSSVRGGAIPELTLKTEPGDTEGDITLPSFIDNYNRAFPTSGFVTPVSVVSYSAGAGFAGGQPADSESVLWRRVNWGESSPVASIEDLQIRYLIGGTVSEIWTPPPRGPHVVGPQSAPPEDPPVGNGPPPSSSSPSSSSTGASASGEHELTTPPLPQPNPTESLQPNALVRGVRVTVTSRSHQANLEGSTVRKQEAANEDGYLRVTFSTRVTTRNLLLRLASREELAAFN